MCIRDSRRSEVNIVSTRSFRNDSSYLILRSTHVKQRWNRPPFSAILLCATFITLRERFDMGVGCCLNIDGRVAIGSGAPYVLPFLVTSEFPSYRNAPDNCSVPLPSLNQVLLLTSLLIALLVQSLVQLSHFHHYRLQGCQLNFYMGNQLVSWVHLSLLCFPCAWQWKSCLPRSL